MADQVKFCRIRLSNTQYKTLDTVAMLSLEDRDTMFPTLVSIYESYCRYKQFESVMPLFRSTVNDTNTDVFVYWDQDRPVAFSLVKRYDHWSVESLQFAWDYANPELRLGIASIEHECAYYRREGFEYLYLGQVNEYKTQFEGYEQLGNPYV